NSNTSSRCTPTAEQLDFGERVEMCQCIAYSPDSVAGADGEIDPTEITFRGCFCRTSSCVVHVCSCLSHGESYNSLCLRPTDKEEEYTRPVFECNTMCQCSESCQNRVVQRGLQFRLEVFKTEKKGWGLRTLEFIAKGRFVCIRFLKSHFFFKITCCTIFCSTKHYLYKKLAQKN
uniref:Pre-SET domain-containing protein n=1 Tax=Falco tinnunculus TaxID=100819 RepID=A0A8C4XR93_FALTI